MSWRVLAGRVLISFWIFLLMGMEVRCSEAYGMDMLDRNG